jgi:hypothetical protein
VLKKLTTGRIKVYTMYIMRKQTMKTIKKLGLLDADFLQGMSVFAFALIIGVIS